MATEISLENAEWCLDALRPYVSNCIKNYPERSIDYITGYLLGLIKQVVDAKADPALLDEDWYKEDQEYNLRVAVLHHGMQLHRCVFDNLALRDDVALQDVAFHE